MKELFEYLARIHELLEQIYTITDNQTTILLSPMEGTEEKDENVALDMITQMMDYKEELTKELFEAEDIFQNEYNRCKQLLNNEQEIVVLELKGLVAAVLERKEAIVAREQSNLVLLQARSKKKLEVVHTPQNPKQVSAAYQKQQKKT